MAQQSNERARIPSAQTFLAPELQPDRLAPGAMLIPSDRDRDSKSESGRYVSAHTGNQLADEALGAMCRRHGLLCILGQASAATGSLSEIPDDDLNWGLLAIENLAHDVKSLQRAAVDQLFHEQRTGGAERASAQGADQ